MATVRIRTTAGNGVRDVSPNSCSYDREKGVYHCRACDEGGNVYRLIRDQGGIEKRQEQAWLVDRGLASGNDWATDTALPDGAIVDLWAWEEGAGALIAAAMVFVN